MEKGSFSKNVFLLIPLKGERETEKEMNMNGPSLSQSKRGKKKRKKENSNKILRPFNFIPERRKEEWEKLSSISLSLAYTCRAWLKAAGKALCGSPLSQSEQLQF